MEKRKTTHTSRPWAIVMDGACSLIYGEGGTGEKVAHCYNGHRLDPELIAAAPAMLATLREAARWINKANVDGAFTGCAAPLAAGRCLGRINSILARIDCAPTGEGEG